MIGQGESASISIQIRRGCPGDKTKAGLNRPALVLNSDKRVNEARRRLGSVVLDAVLLEEVDGLLDVGDALGVLVGDLQGVVVGAELFLKGHD